MERVKGTGRKFSVRIVSGAEIVPGAGSVHALSFDDGSMWLAKCSRKSPTQTTTGRTHLRGFRVKRWGILK